VRTKREVIRIDEEKCTGCGQCIPGCPEGALQVIDGKARLVSDLFCDGLGACVGECPEGALTVEEREAEPYDEARVMANVIKAGANTIAAHLKHLNDHGACEYYNTALAYLKEQDIPVPGSPEPERLACGCPGSSVKVVARPPEAEPAAPAGTRPSRLRNWPVQIVLIPTSAPYLRGADLLVAADCVCAASPGFHEGFVRGRVLLVGCPKLDDSGFYRQKLAEIFKLNAPNSVRVARMIVPCCSGLTRLVQQAIADSGRPIPFAEVVVEIDGKTATNQ
jgi:ferredoxin